MATNSHIEWTEATWNPVTGCDKVSPGCAHCYAERMAKGSRNNNIYSFSLYGAMNSAIRGACATPKGQPNFGASIERLRRKWTSVAVDSGRPRRLATSAGAA